MKKISKKCLFAILVILFLGGTLTYYISELNNKHTHYNYNYIYTLSKGSASKKANIIATFESNVEWNAERNCEIFKELHDKEYGYTGMSCWRYFYWDD